MTRSAVISLSNFRFAMFFPPYAFACSAVKTVGVTFFHLCASTTSHDCKDFVLGAKVRNG